MKVVKLGDICEFRNGLWTGKKGPFIRVGVIRNTNFTKSGTLDDSDIAYLDVEQRQFEKRKLNYGDIILEKSGGGPKQPVGRVIIFDKNEGDFSFSNFTSALSIKDASELDFNYLHRFLFYFYQSGKTEAMQKHATGIRNLNFDEYKQIEIPLPSLKEQRLIVARLEMAFEKIDNAIKNTEKNITNDELLFTTSLEDRFANAGGETLTINDVCTIKGGKRMPKGRKLTKNKTDHPYIRVSDFDHEGGVDTADVHFVPDDVWPSISNYIITSDDVFLSIAGSIGITGIVPSDLSGANLTENACRMIPNETILNKKYLYYFTLTKSFKDQAEGGTRTTAQPKLALTRIKDIKLEVPSLVDQIDMIEYFDQLHRQTKELVRLHKKKLSNLLSLKQSLLGQAFSEGRLE